MPLPSPNLDDRNFESLLRDARDRIRTLSPDWTDLSASDPGIVLLELFAYLTDTMIYRLNRIPDKAYVAFLNLLGVRLQPPSAAGVDLVFSIASASERPVEIPRGTRVTVGRSGGSEPPMFVTDVTVSIPPGKTEVTVRAHHCDLIIAEFAGMGTGMPGLSIVAQRPPIISPTGDDLDLIVGVEAAPADLGERIPAIQFGNKAYRVWTEVERFSNLAPDSYVYVADRLTGMITFAPQARMPGPDGTLEDQARPLALAPAAGREIRLWYRRGGGPEGNVAPNTLTSLKDPIAGVHVTNPNAATGGRAAESLENALVRGPQQLHSIDRAVTARDYELVALTNSRAIARARAVTRAALWTFAKPGTVELLVVPYLSEDQRPAGQVTLAALQQNETEEARSQIQQAIDERRPLGTTCFVNWARYKTVRIVTSIVVRREEDQDAVRARVMKRLHETINPLPTDRNPMGWPFGQSLRVSHVYDMALGEPGVRWVDGVQLLVEEVPEQNVSFIADDASQLHLWYVASNTILYRSLNDGEGWEPAGRFPGEQIEVIGVHPDRPGLIAVSARPTGTGAGSGSVLHISHDSGETWQAATYSTAFHVEDIAWTLHGDVPFLLLATDAGLFELALRPGGSPVQILVDSSNQKLGFYAVAASTDTGGVTSVAVAAQNTGGVYLSTEGGRTNTFRRTGLQGQDIRVLAVRYEGIRSFLWAGAATPGGDDPGKGCFMWEFRGKQDPPEGWQSFNAGWTGGTCQSLAFIGSRVFAASHRAGVLRLDLGGANPAWQPSNVRCGLPMRDPGRFYPVLTVATDQEGKWVMAGGSQGTYRSHDSGSTYQSSASKESGDRVTLPRTWLFVSGEHDIEVLSEDDASRD